MEYSQSPTDAAIEMIRLFFPLRQEAEVAIALTNFLGPRAGKQIVELRPETTMGEVFRLARSEEWTTAEFSYMLEIAGLEAFDDELEQMTFREFVHYSAGKRSESDEPNP